MPCWNDCSDNCIKCLTANPCLNTEPETPKVTKDLLEVDKLTGKKTLNEAQIEALTCSVYRIEKQTGYNETDLSTIRTIITPIK